jgi:hypothetical protein
MLDNKVLNENLCIIEWSGKIIMKREYVRINQNMVKVHLKELTAYSPKAFFFSFLRWGETESTWYVGH